MLYADIKKFQFASDHDGLEIHALTAVPSGNINGILQIVHGMCEYKERYLPFMDYLAQEGFITVIHDNRGHGQSVVSQEDLGFLYKDGDIGYVKDIKKLMKIVKEVYPSIPYFLLGHSMGSLGVRCFAKEHDDEIDGLFILGCPCYSYFSNFGIKVNKSLIRKNGSRFRSQSIAEAFEKNNNRNFQKENLKSAWISANKENVEKYISDPLCNYMYTLNGYDCLLKLLKSTYSKDGWEIKNPSLPIRFLSGKDDPLRVSDKKFFNAINMFENLGYDSVSHRLFDGMRHEILNESNNIIVYRDIAKSMYSWLDRINGSTDSSEPTITFE